MQPRLDDVRDIEDWAPGTYWLRDATVVVYQDGRIEIIKRHEPSPEPLDGYGY